MLEKILGWGLVLAAPAMITFAVYLMYMPAGLIVGGLSCAWIELRLDNKKGGS